MPLTSDWLTWLGLAFEVFGSLNWLNVLIVVGAFVALVLLMIAQFRPGDGFDLRSMVARRTFVMSHEYWTIDPGRCYQLGGFLVTSWGFFALIGKGALSDLYLIIYAVAWLASPGINQIVASRFPVAPGAPITGGTVTTETTETSTTATTTAVKP